MQVRLACVQLKITEHLKMAQFDTVAGRHLRLLST